MVEVGHGNGLGASSLQIGRSRLDDVTMLTTVREALTSSRMGVFMAPGWGTSDDLEAAVRHGADIVRIAAHCTEADVTERHLGVVRGLGAEAQGVLLMGIMGVGIPETLQRLNGLKNVLAAIVNAVAGLLFAVVADVDWRIVALIGIGSVIGGQIGATVGRRLPAPVLRGVIVVVGAVALVVFLVS